MRGRLRAIAGLPFAYPGAEPHPEVLSTAPWTCGGEVCSG